MTKAYTDTGTSVNKMVLLLWVSIIADDWLHNKMKVSDSLELHLLGKKAISEVENKPGLLAGWPAKWPGTVKNI